MPTSVDSNNLKLEIFKTHKHVSAYSTLLSNSY